MQRLQLSMILAWAICHINYVTNAMILLRRNCRRDFQSRLFSSSSDLIQQGKSKTRSFGSGNGNTGNDSEEANAPENFNLLGPPSYLSSLKVGESCKIPLLGDDLSSPSLEFLSIKRLSQNPDIFLVPNFISKPERLINAAKSKGLKSAGTRKSQPGTVRKNSYLTWLAANNGVDSSDGTNLVQKATTLSKMLFVHESLQMLNDKEEYALPEEYVTPEEMQIAKYDSAGSFGLHHDGFNRFLTVLTYLNGVGGTYFPLAQTRQSKDDEDVEMSPPKIQIDDDGFLSSNGYLAGKDGLLIVGEEGEEWYVDASVSPTTIDCGNGENSAIVRVHAGDSIVFYNYNLLEDDNDETIDLKLEDENNKIIDLKKKVGHNVEWRSFHAGLPVPPNEEEKWIATNWFRSDALAGPFSHLYSQRLLESISNK
mmetsp:Transcript_7807/g.11337  ORF Transcript_7807/g.11337 Transcript_7807/m.11337 type:complete len:424 (+) Transcript_7807:74-1345(+)